MMRRALARQLSAVSMAKLTAAAAPAFSAPAMSRPTLTVHRAFTDAQTVREPHPFEQIAYSQNMNYVESLYEKFKADKASVDKAWYPIFENLSSASPDEALVQTWNRPFSRVQGEGATLKECADNMKLAWMVRAYEMKGHLIADLDPLGMYDADLSDAMPEELDPSTFGFSAADMEQEFHVSIGANFGGVVTQGGTPMKLREIIDFLKKTFCQKLGVEFMHAGFSTTRMWFRNEIVATSGKPSNDIRRKTLMNIIRGERFEKFLQRKYTTHKRFGLEGAETLIAAMNATIDVGAEMGAENFVLGMPHRGRLNVLVNVCGKPPLKVFHEFEGKADKKELPKNASGDVKYHMGLSNTVKTDSGKTVNVSLLANPSHLECVNPLVLGRARAKQMYSGDTKFQRTVPILLHGDAAFSGQGVCYESMGLASLENYDVGGTVHIVVNNQIGFTTPPQQSRSASYCTDLAKVVDAPVFHVNGDDADEVVRVANMAIKYRMEFKKDVIIDLVCYRRHGHNETDQPKFTQPLMYAKIEQTPTILTLYGKKCVDEGVISADERDKLIAEYDAFLRDQFEEAQQGGHGFEAKQWDENPTDEYASSIELSSLRDTGVSRKNLRELGAILTKIPDGFNAHKTVKKVLESRRKAIDSGEGIDWGLAEQLAFSTLALEGIHVRLTGQDVERGTFAQRHCKFHDVNTGEAYLPLQHLHPRQSPITVQNSSLSEFGVCGFELGYSMENPKSLVVWEAQFGDFSNGAQVIFDQFLASGEAKWIRQSSLVVSLPHGYDGQGPEHSSGRIERYLQLSDCPDTFPKDFNPDDWQHISEKRIRAQNWQVCYPTTSVNYYHVLRRQVHREFRKPLINFFSKSNLRDNSSLSNIDEFKAGTTIRCVIDHHEEIAKPRKIVFCTGQVYRKLRTAQDADMENRGDVALIRLEQIAPFCWEPIWTAVKKYRAAAGADIPVVWAQEEPKNMGAWSFVRVRMNVLLKELGSSGRVQYAGRVAAASPAPGHAFMYQVEEKAIVDDVFKKE